MIVSANEFNGFSSVLAEAADNNPFACRIISLYNSYRPGLAFVDYWMITDDSGECLGAIARNGSNFILFITDKCDLDEVSSFMRVAGATGAICGGKYRLLLYGSRTVSGSVLMRNKPFELSGNDEIKLIQPDIRSAYELIVRCADANFVPPAFEDFYVDVNHKLRHKTMRLCGIEADNRLAAVAMTVAESGGGAVLGAVACDPDYRRKGYGSAIVKYITNMLVAENKCVYLHRAKNANVSFYNNLGFKESGKWREYYFEG
ncbi:MAG: GNAT family N-acetyltransferase [Ruminococcus sp.]|nr:GNAT family N-acetyltransferase [Ruminococcus sp.]